MTFSLDERVSNPRKGLKNFDCDILRCSPAAILSQIFARTACEFSVARFVVRLRNQAITFAQELNGRIYVQHEILGFNQGATVFAPIVKRFLEQNYPGHQFRCVGDPKGQDKGQATEQSSYDIWRAHGMPVTPAPVKQNDISQRLEAVAFVLNDNPGGQPRLVISPRCRTLIVGMAGRYHLAKEEDGELRPKKGRYSNLCDCLQYGCLALGEGRRMRGLIPAANLKPVAGIRSKPKGPRRRVA